MELAPLTGRRTRLRAVLPSDYEYLYMLVTHPEVAWRWRNRGNAISFDAFVQQLWAGTLVHFVIERKENDQRLGYVQAFDASERNGIDVDANGNLYIAEYGGVKTRKVDASDNITTIAGTGAVCGSAGDGAAATSATLCNPRDVSFDATTNALYIADGGNNRIRCVSTSNTSGACGQSSPSTGYIYRIAGGGGQNPGNGGAGVDGQLSSAPSGVSVKAGGNLYISSYTTGGNLRVLYGPDP